MKKLFLLLSISLVYISCEKVIPFEGDVNIPKLVINSIFQSDSTFKVHVSSSRSVIDTASFQNIEDAVVTIKDDNGSIIETLNYVENGFYIGQTYPQENQTYSLQVSHPNYSNITSSDSLPSPITINSIDTSTTVDPINGDRLQITLNFNDPESSQNYYLIETYSVNEYLVIKNSDTTEYELDTTKQFMVLTDEVFQNGGSPFREQGLFNDLLFNGQNKALELSLFLSLPASIALLIASDEIISALFGYGQFSESSVLNSANALYFFSLGLPAFAMIKVFSNFFFANHNTKTPFYISLISVILNILISIYFFKSIGFIIIPIATTISSWFNLIILFLFLKKRNLFSFNNIFIKRFFKIVFSSILMGLFFNYLMIIFNEQLSFENSLKSFYLIMSVILGLGFYLLTSYLIKAFQLEDIKLRY